MQAHVAHAPAVAEGFLPHGFCYLWNKPLLYTHLWSDLVIGASYVVISFALAALVHRARRDIPFSLVFVAFGLFIITCGLTHFMEIWTLWEPVYWLSGGVKVVTAAASAATAIAMPFMVPRVHGTIRDARSAREREIAAARAAALEEANAELVRLNTSLQAALTEAEESRQAAEDARRVAEEANAAKSDFLAVMSHELRTPLNAILGYTDLLALQAADAVQPGQAEKLGRIRSSAVHLVGLIDQVLRFARLEAGEDVVAPEPFDAVTLTRDVASMVAPLADRKGLDFRIVLPDHAAPLSSDPQKVRQVLLNLLSNAINYTAAGGVTLTLAAPTAGPVTFEVADTGMGIARDHLARVFDAFWQAAPATTRTVGGTGLGLSVSRRLAELLGGTLTVESELGVGSRFTLALPVAPPASNPAAPAGP